MKRFVAGVDREQSTLLPECLDDFIDESNPVRVIDAFVDALDLAELGFDGVEPAATGRPSYHPSILLKLYIYGYLNRVQSSRRLEREAGRNVEVMWLLGRLIPDHKTIADFRKNNGGALRKVCARFHDKNVGQVLDYLDELGIADDTFVMYSTDNGPHMNSWPDGGMTPFRSEKNTNWEGAFRVPMLVRWPSKIKPGQISNEIVQHHDWFPTFLAMAGDPDVVEKLKTGYQAIGRTYKNHIDGYNLLPYLTGEAKESPRKFFMYLSDDGDVLGLRYDNWKMVFMEQRCHGTLQIWAEPFTRLRVPKLFNLRTDPYERADQTSNTYYDWFLQHVYLLYGAQAAAAQWAETFKDFPPVQKPNTFTLDDALRMMHETASGMH